MRVFLIKWQFLTKDQNDDLTENWVQDQGALHYNLYLIYFLFENNFVLIAKEPDACVIDSWAQGYVQAVSIENEFKKNKRGRYAYF